MFELMVVRNQKYPVELYVHIASQSSVEDMVTFGSCKCNKFFRSVTCAAFKESANRIYEGTVGKIKQFIYLKQELYAEKTRGLFGDETPTVRLFKDATYVIITLSMHFIKKQSPVEFFSDLLKVEYSLNKDSI
jgi:hypothetical protein